jgi:hypothetical protein
LLVQQTELRATQVPPLVRYITSQLARAFPGCTFNVRLYGSLHHGLYVCGSSKIHLDLAPAECEGQLPNGNNVLHILAALLQNDVATCPFVTYPLLLWHRTVQRPVMLLLYWNGILVHVTYNNRAAIQVSELMWRVLALHPYLRLTLLHWKTHLRTHTTELVGPNSGQVSTYALFTIVLGGLSDLHATCSTLRLFEASARQLVVRHLAMVPRFVRTPDALTEHINLTARSFLAPELTKQLATLVTL